MYKKPTKVKVGQLYYEFPNGAACSPMCGGHYFTVVYIDDTEEVEAVALRWALDCGDWPDDRRTYQIRLPKNYIINHCKEVELPTPW